MKKKKNQPECKWYSSKSTVWLHEKKNDLRTIVYFSLLRETILRTHLGQILECSCSGYYGSHVSTRQEI